MTDSTRDPLHQARATRAKADLLWWDAMIGWVAVAVVLLGLAVGAVR